MKTSTIIYSVFTDTNAKINDFDSSMIKIANCLKQDNVFCYINSLKN
jgi:hypothetical protein